MRASVSGRVVSILGPFCSCENQGQRGQVAWSGTHKSGVGFQALRKCCLPPGVTEEVGAGEGPTQSLVPQLHLHRRDQAPPAQHTPVAGSQRLCPGPCWTLRTGSTRAAVCLCGF